MLPLFVLPLELSPTRSGFGTIIPVFCALVPVLGVQGTSAKTLVTRIAATSKSSDCNRNSKKSLRLRKHPLKPTLWTWESPVCVVFIVFQKHHMGLETPQNTLRLQGCDSESQRFFWPNAIFVIATLRFYCNFCGKSLRLRSCDCQSLAICDCDCVGHQGQNHPFGSRPFANPPEELIFGKGMRTAAFQFSECSSSLNRPDLFTEIAFPMEILAKPLIH